MPDMEIKLSQERVAIIDDDDFDKVSKYKWHYVRFGYACANPAWKGPSLRMHRIIMDAKEGQVVDHVNGDRLDNRKANLRFCTQSQNLMNRRKRDNTPWPYKGYGEI